MGGCCASNKDAAERRKGVLGEGYNPEEDEDDGPPTVHPKSEQQRALLGEAIRHILLFKSLEPEQINQVVDAMFQKHVTKGEFVIKQGDDGDNFYVIESGKYRATVQGSGNAAPKTVATYEGTGSFGELALMYNVPRAASVQAETDGSVWGVDRRTFRRIVVKNAYRRRQTYEALLDSVPMLKSLEKYERMNLADALTTKTYSAGQVIIRQGDAANGMYFVEEGEARVTRKDERGEEREINHLKKGDYFGELALITKKPRAATVTAVGKMKAAFLDVDAFERLLGPCMNVMKRNVDEYENQLIAIFGSKSAAMQDIRK